MNIEWEEGAVCYANGEQHKYDLNKIENLIIFDDFKLNEIRQGDYVKGFELDTEQKYNNAVKVFELFGSERLSHLNWGHFWVSKYTQVYLGKNRLLLGFLGKRKLTYTQLMAIGKLKRAMIEREKSPIDVSGFNTVEQSVEKRAKRNKARQAYKILNDLDYEYDLVKQKWYKKQYA